MSEIDDLRAEVERLRDAIPDESPAFAAALARVATLEKALREIAKKWPCTSAEDIARAALEGAK